MMKFFDKRTSLVNFRFIFPIVFVCILLLSPYSCRSSHPEEDIEPFRVYERLSNRIKNDITQDITQEEREKLFSAGFYYGLPFLLKDAALFAPTYSGYKYVTGWALPYFKYAVINNYTPEVFGNHFHTVSLFKGMEFFENLYTRKRSSINSTIGKVAFDLLCLGGIASYGNNWDVHFFVKGKVENLLGENIAGLFEARLGLEALYICTRLLHKPLSDGLSGFLKKLSSVREGKRQFSEEERQIILGISQMVCGTVLTYSKVGTFNLNTVRENNESFTMADTKRPGTYEHWYPTIALPFPFKNKLFSPGIKVFSPDISSSLGHNLIFFGFRNLITGGLKKYTHLRNRFGQDNYLKSFLVDAFTLGVIGTTSAYYYFEPQRTKNEILWETAFGVSSAYIATQSVFQLGSIGYNKAKPYIPIVQSKVVSFKDSIMHKIDLIRQKAQDIGEN